MTRQNQVLEAVTQGADTMQKLRLRFPGWKAGSLNIALQMLKRKDMLRHDDGVWSVKETEQCFCTPQLTD